MVGLTAAGNCTDFVDVIKSACVALVAAAEVDRPFNQHSKTQLKHEHATLS